MFVVVITDPDAPLVAPRAVGPFEDFDTAQAFSLTLVQKWQDSAGNPPTAFVTRVEESQPGVVIGEIQP
ncbi:MAG TPA: hypothetical protein VHO01_02805 [Jatrophihabitans sp.]|nr:hypothetical protein [Jatrophihabitans sp.]